MEASGDLATAPDERPAQPTNKSEQADVGESAHHEHEFMHAPRQRCAEDCGTFSAGSGYQEVEVWSAGLSATAPILSYQDGIASAGRVNPVQRGPPLSS